MPNIGGGISLPDIGRAPVYREPVDPLVQQIKKAQLANLLNEAGFQNRQISLQERNAETSKTLGFANLSLEQKKAEVGKFLAENNVAHDSAALAEANRHNTVTESQTSKQIDTGKLTQIFGDLSRMPVDPQQRTKLLADYMAENGDTSLQKVLAKTEATTAKAKGEFGPGSAPPVTTPTTSVADVLSAPNPGYDPELGKKLLKGITDVPLAASNLGGQIYNYGIAAPSNLINSIAGLPPLERAKWASTYAEALGYQQPAVTPAPVLAAKTTPASTPVPKNFYDGPPGYPDTTSPKKKARQRRGMSEFAY